MNICFLAPANNYHTKKWCKWFSSRGHKIYVISLIEDEIENATVISINTNAKADSSDFRKLGYLLSIRKVKSLIADIKPDIISVHYATSYGTIAALAGLSNYVLSVWGADIYDFPNKSFVHKAMLKFSLSKAKHIMSTSRAMAIETQKYVTTEIDITPFGVDMKLFSPNVRDRKDRLFVIGTIKTLSPKYGIDYLLNAVAIIRENYPNIPIQLRIAGKGSHEEEYKHLANELQINESVEWLGYLDQSAVAKEWANMDVAVIPSTLDSESFGVSAVEAQACGVPVIISDIPGLMEATLPGQSSLVVKRKDAKQLADSILELYWNEDFRILLGKKGREYVEDIFSLETCFKKIEDLFEKYKQ